MNKFLNVQDFVRYDSHGNVCISGGLHVDCFAYAQTPLLEDASNKLATTEWVKAYGESLVLNGVPGPAGPPGPAGADGAPGPQGEAGYSPTTQELLDMVFDVQGNYYTEKIKPLAIETMLLEVGAMSQNFQLLNIVFKVDPANQMRVTSTAGKLTHFNINNEIREWTVAASDTTNLSLTTAYYIYIQVPRSGTTGGQVLITTDKIVWNSVTNKYTFLVGILHSQYLGVRQISLTYGITTIAGQYITTGRISANNADTYFDLNTGEIHGKITFTAGSSGYANLTDAPDLSVYAPSSTLGNLAYEDMVELAKLGTTIIEGGYIKTNLVDTNALRVSGSFATVSNVQEAKIEAIQANEEYVETALNAVASVEYVNGIRDNLQAQVDGVVVTWFYNYDPTLTNFPASDWTTTALKNQHLGDLFYNTETGYAYRFALVNNTSYEWVLVQDTAVTEALALAAQAKDTADGKRRVFTSTPTTPYDIGDLWVEGEAGDIKFATVSRASGPYVAGDWSKASKYTDDTAVVTLAATLKAMAYEDKVELAKLGDTLILGGYIKSDLIDVNAIIVNGNLTTVANATAYTDTALATAKDYADAAANALKGVTDNFTTIDGGLITSNTIKLGTQITSVAGITGTGTTGSSVRFWAGDTYENRATAPFRVLQDGTLHATGATISGAINITGGSGYANLTDKPTLGTLAGKNSVDLSSDVTGSLPNTSVSGLKALALKDNITRDLVTDLGAMAAIDKLTTTNAATYIDDSAIVTKFIAANAIIGTKILAGSITADKLSVGDLSALNATIGGWTINNTAITSGANRLAMSSTGVISVKNSLGVDKLIMRAGPLTPLVGTASSVSVPFTTLSLTSQAYANTNTTFNGIASSFSVASAGIYSGQFSTTGATVTISSPSNWGGYAYVGVFCVIYAENTFSTQIARIYLTSGSTGVANQSITLPAYTNNVSINFPAPGTYYSRLEVQYQINSNTIATTTFGAFSASAATASLGQAIGTTELTDEGFQVVNSSNTYFKIDRANFSSGAYVSVGGAMTLTGDLTANASDQRLKQDITPISNALDKIKRINGVHYTWTDEAIKLNPHLTNEMQVGLLAQEVQRVLPEVVKPAPFDIDTTTKQSISGKNYLTVQYEKVVPLLLEAIKELNAKIEKLENNK